MEIIVKNGKFNIPDAFKMSERKRVLRYKTPNCAVFEEFRDNREPMIQRWFRDEDKEPFVPENHI